MTRISGGITTGIGAPNTTHTALSGQPQAVATPPLAQQLQHAFFGRVAPRTLLATDFPDLEAMLRLLNRCRAKMASMHGDSDDDYRIVLAEDAVAMIDAGGTIYMGAAFLMNHLRMPEVPVGALAHEIGHRPKRWNERPFQLQPGVTLAQLEALCREEETRADIFAGKALAELGFSCEPLIAFLQRTQVRPHPEYFPAAVRAEIIREAHAGRAYRAGHRRKLFRAFDRHTSPRGHIRDV